MDRDAAHQESGRARIEFRARPISEMGPSDPPEWAWEGYAALGYVTLFSALWKSGKTTLISHLLRDLEARVGLAKGAEEKIRVLVISEESEPLWARRRDDLGIRDHVHPGRAGTRCTSTSSGCTCGRR